MMEEVQGIEQKLKKSLHLKKAMYRKNEQPDIEGFILPFNGKLDSNNRWVKLSSLIPWDEVEKLYEKNFTENGMGAPAKTVRMALGALIIKEKLRLTDEETVEQIVENPYLQFFVGLESFSDQKPFDPSMMVHFRTRLAFTDIQAINDMIIEKNKKDHDKDSDDNKASGGSDDKPNKGKLIIDATCAPADIRYPTDLSILNEARENAERIIDELHETYNMDNPKPRTYRKKARKDFLWAIRKKKLRKNHLRKAIGKQIRYIRRDLKIIAELGGEKQELGLPEKLYKRLLVIREVFDQQQKMYKEKTHRIEKRIVSISQPHVRPIVRGKDRADVEFGAKLSISLVNGLCSIDRLDWEPYNESQDLICQVEKYEKRYGCYPESLHADKIYRTRKNIEYCKEKGIRISGPRLGRPVIPNPSNEKDIKLNAKVARADEIDRIAIEGKFGNAKRRYTLGRIMAKLQNTSETVIGIVFLVMNLDTLAKCLLRFINFCTGVRRWIFCFIRLSCVCW